MNQTSEEMVAFWLLKQMTALTQPGDSCFIPIEANNKPDSKVLIGLTLEDCELLACALTSNTIWNNQGHSFGHRSLALAEAFCKCLVQLGDQGMQSKLDLIHKTQELYGNKK